MSKVDAMRRLVSDIDELDKFIQIMTYDERYEQFITTLTQMTESGGSRTAEVPHSVKWATRALAETVVKTAKAKLEDLTKELEG